MALLAAMLLTLLPVLAASPPAGGNDITSKITIDSLNISEFGDPTPLSGDGATGLTFELSQAYQVNLTWSTALTSIAVNDYFVIEVDFGSGELYDFNGTVDIPFPKGSSTIVAQMTWHQVTLSTYQIVIAFTAPVTGVDIGGTAGLFFAYGFDEDKAEQTNDWEFEINSTTTFTFTGENGTHPGTGPVDYWRLSQALLKSGTNTSDNSRGYWSVIVNDSASSAGDMFATPPSGVTITDTFFNDATYAAQCITPLHMPIPDYHHGGHYRASFWRKPNYAPTPTKVNTGEGAFGSNIGAASTDDAYFYIYTMTEAKMKELWDWRYDLKPYPTSGTDGELQEVLIYGARYKAFHDTFTSATDYPLDLPVTGQYGFNESRDISKYFEPIALGMVKSISLTDGGNGGFEIELDTAALDGKAVYIVYSTDLTVGTTGAKYGNKVTISPDTKLLMNEERGEFLKTWGVGTITASNAGIVLNKVDATDNTPIAAPATFSLMRYMGAVEHTSSGSKSKWTLNTSGGSVGSGDLFPAADTYFELVETTPPTGYQINDTPIYFTLTDGDATTPYKLTLGTVDSSGTFIVTGVPSHVTFDADKRTITVENTPNPASTTPAITTSAAEKTTGNKTITAANPVTIVDTVTYSNLTPSTEYTLKGILMDKSTGAPLEINGSAVPEVTADFTSSGTGNGTTTLEFPIDASTLAGKNIVVFEELYEKGGTTVVAEHEDINDAAQTVTIVAPPTTPYTPSDDDPDPTLPPSSTPEVTPSPTPEITPTPTPPTTTDTDDDDDDDDDDGTTTTPDGGTTTTPEPTVPPDIPGGGGGGIVPFEKDDGEIIFIQLDEDGTPLGKWVQNEDGDWELVDLLEDEIPRGAFLPKTGSVLITGIFAVGTAMTASGLFIGRKRREDDEENVNAE